VTPLESAWFRSHHIDGVRRLAARHTSHVSANSQEFVVKGVRIVDTGPFREAFLELPVGVTVLYGLNGAGKSTVLRAVRDAFVGVTKCELHFVCGLNVWPSVVTRSPWVFLLQAGLSSGESELYRKNQLERVLGILSDIGVEADGSAVADLAVKVSLNLGADTPLLVASMFDAVSQGRFVRVRGGVGVSAVADHDSDTQWSRFWSVVLADTKDHDTSPEVVNRELRDWWRKGWGPDITGYSPFGGESEEISFFIGMVNLISVTRAHLGIPTPSWCGDILWQESGWGPWPEPIVDPEALPDLCDITVTALVIVARAGLQVPGSDAEDGGGFEGRDSQGSWSSRSEHEATRGLGVSGTRNLDGRPNLEHVRVSAQELLTAEADAFKVSPAVIASAEALGSLASEINQKLLRGAPLLDCRVLPINCWAGQQPVSWVAIDPTGAEVQLEDLSDAQRRWSKFAIRLAVGVFASEAPPILLIDEPERGLHRSAERHLFNGLAEVSERMNAITVIATHSPFALGDARFNLRHVMRGAEGHSMIQSFDPDLRVQAEALGLAASDLLHLCRTALLVEGRHEELILGELFADEFEALGVEMFSVRGAKNLRTASDAQLLFRYTDARLAVVVDNLDPQAVQSIWAQARERKSKGLDFREPLKDLTAGKSKASEGQFLKTFLDEALTNDRQDRVRVTSLSLPDIIEYLPVRAIAPNAPADTTWSMLRTRHEKAAQGIDFKKWMSREYGADYREETIREAVRMLQALPEDFTTLLAFLAP
jgi:energy-coupling factor transporter ATP-binding protein EcfA2